MLRHLAFVLLLCAAGCAPKFERPDLTVTGIEMRGGNLLRQNFLVKFQVQNPNQRALPVKGLHAELSVGGERIASGVSNRALWCRPWDKSEFDMTITANMALALLKLANQPAIRSITRSRGPPTSIYRSCTICRSARAALCRSSSFTNSLKIL